MDFLRSHRNICSAVAAFMVAAFMVAVLVVYSYGSFRSYAAAPEVSTLPADIDIDVDYDLDHINLTYSGNTYTFNRHSFYMDLFPSDLPVYPRLDEAYSALGESGIFHYVNSSDDMICHLISGSSGWSSREAFAYCAVLY